MTYQKSIFSLAIIASLAACGGTGPEDTTTPPPPAPVISSIVASVASPTYSPALEGEELAAFNLLNAERSRCGFGKVAQSAQLDATAKGHADWQLVNNYKGHFQVAATPGFTGVSPTDRATAAGYAPIGVLADENTSIIGLSAKTGFGEAGVRGLLNAPYHARGLLSGYRDVGFSVRNDIDTASTFGPRVINQINLAYKSSDGPQLPGASDVLTFPCDGSTAVVRQLTNETPSPVPGRDLLVSPLGSSIYVGVREGQILTITNASMTKVSNGAAVTLRTPVTSANDVNNIYRAHEGYVTADAPLDAGTQYSVTINGANDGVIFTRTFAFTTAF